MSEEEKIRRAELIAERRSSRIPADKINSKRKVTSFRKLSLQILTSIFIFGLCYFLHQNNSNAIELIKPVISTDTDFHRIYSDINDMVKNIKMEENKNNASQNNKNDEEGNVLVEEQNINNSKITADTISKEETTKIEEKMDDITFIKNNMSFIKPLQGKVTSGYGIRTPTETITANHEGVDIAAEEGTYIVASMKGNADVVSEEGEYGKHIIIKNGEISTLYAHCSEILIKEGEQIEQGKAIAKVGSTGKSTGPHLHFEIRRNDNAVNPEEILEL